MIPIFKTHNNDEGKTDFTKVYGDSAASLSTTKFWTAKIKRGHTSIFVVQIRLTLRK